MNTRAARRNVRTIPSLVMALAALLLGACVHYVPDQREAVASPVPTNSAGCGLQELPASWQAALKPTTLTSSNDLVLAMRDATTGRTLYVGSRSTVILTEPGAEPRVVFQFLGPEQVWRAMIDGDWIVVLTADDVGVTRAHVRRVDGAPFLLPLREGDDHMASPFALVRNGTLFVSVIPDPSTKAEVEIAVNLVTGAHTDLMVPHSTVSFLRWNDTVILAESISDSRGKITAIREDTFAQVEVPAVLAGLGDAVWVASDGATAAWSPPTSPGLTVARQGWSSARDYMLPGDRVEQISVWGHYLVALSGRRFWVLDVETGQYAPLTAADGFAIISGGQLATAELADATGDTKVLRELDLASVPALPACTR